LIFLFVYSSKSQSQTIKPQIEFGGVKLGTKATDLGFEIDEDKAFYVYKDKYYLSGNHLLNGHPISKIRVDCDGKNRNEKVGGFGCNDHINDVKEKYFSDIIAMCSASEITSRADEVDPIVYYNKKTNQYWYIDKKTNRITSLGIVKNVNMHWQNCKIPFSNDDVLNIKLGMNAKTILGDSFYEGIEYFGLKEGVSIWYLLKSKDNSITKIHYSCSSKERLPIIKLNGFGCGDDSEKLLVNFKDKILQKCGPILHNGRQHVWDLYLPETQEFWSIDSETNLIDGYGYSSSNFKDWNICDPNKVVSLKKPQLSQVQSTNTKNNSKPVSLKANGKILKIKGIALGDGPSVCPDIKTEKQTSERRYINTCFIDEGDENYTIVFFDWSKSYVVRVFRVTYVNDGDRFINDALDFYGNSIFKMSSNFTDSTFYDYGDVENGIGFRIKNEACWYISNSGVKRYDTKSCDAKIDYKITFLMNDALSFKKSLDDGYNAYRKEDF
jgi:hypothetical protein